MTCATIREVHHNLAAYIRRVEQGEVIEIRRRNKIVARLTPSESMPAEPPLVDWSELEEWRRELWGGKPAPGKPTSEIVYESRGDR